MKANVSGVVFVSQARSAITGSFCRDVIYCMVWKMNDACAKLCRQSSISVIYMTFEWSRMTWKVGCIFACNRHGDLEDKPIGGLVLTVRYRLAVSLIGIVSCALVI